MRPLTVKYAMERDREAFISAMRSYEPFEIDEDSFDYYLYVLPPVHMGKNVVLPNGRGVRASFGFAEGFEEITVFWGSAGRFFGCRTKTINPLA